MFLLGLVLNYSRIFLNTYRLGRDLYIILALLYLQKTLFWELASKLALLGSLLAL